MSTKKTPTPARGMRPPKPVVKYPTGPQEPNETVAISTDPDVDPPKVMRPPSCEIMEPWSPDGITFFNRVMSESHFKKKSDWEREKVYDEYGKHVHTIERRTLTNGQTVVRPHSYLADDWIEGEPK